MNTMHYNEFVIPIIFGFVISYIPQHIPGYGEYSLYINLGIDFMLFPVIWFNLKSHHL